MAGKHFGRHKAWRRDGRQLVHESGLRLDVVEGDGYTDLETEEASLAIFQAQEASRGVPVHDLASRLQRLLREAAEWYKANP